MVIAIVVEEVEVVEEEVVVVLLLVVLVLCSRCNSNSDVMIINCIIGAIPLLAFLNPSTFDNTSTVSMQSTDLITAPIFLSNSFSLQATKRT